MKIHVSQFWFLPTVWYEKNTRSGRYCTTFPAQSSLLKFLVGRPACSRPKTVDPFSRSICNPRPGDTWDSVEGNAVLLWSFCTCNHGDLVSGNQVQWRLGRAPIPSPHTSTFSWTRRRIYSEGLKVQQDSVRFLLFDRVADRKIKRNREYDIVWYK